jgi:hypothetical protein
MSIQIITPIFNNGDSITLNLTYSQYEEIKLALDYLNKSRQLKTSQPIINFAQHILPSDTNSNTNSSPPVTFRTISIPYRYCL